MNVVPRPIPGTEREQDLSFDTLLALAKVLRALGLSYDEAVELMSISREVVDAALDDERRAEL